MNTIRRRCSVCYGFECLLVVLTLTELAELKRLLKTIRYLFGLAADVADCRRMNDVVYFTSLTFFSVMRRVCFF